MTVPGRGPRHTVCTVYTHIYPTPYIRRTEWAGCIKQTVYTHPIPYAPDGEAVLPQLVGLEAHGQRDAADGVGGDGVKGTGSGLKFEVPECFGGTTREGFKLKT